MCESALGVWGPCAWLLTLGSLGLLKQQLPILLQCDFGQTSMLRFDYPTVLISQNQIMHNINIIVGQKVMEPNKNAIGTLGVTFRTEKFLDYVKNRLLQNDAYKKYGENAQINPQDFMTILKFLNLMLNTENFKVCMKQLSQDGKNIQKKKITEIIEGIFKKQKAVKLIKAEYSIKNVYQYEFTHQVWQSISTAEQFKDPQNPKLQKASQFINLATKIPNYEIFQEAPSVFDRDKRKQKNSIQAAIEAKDISQRAVGDCYFLSVVATIAQRSPQLLQSLFILKKNKNHIYGVFFYVNGKWQQIILDLYFPVDSYGNYVCVEPHHNQIWVLLLEKAWAKVNVSYDNTESGHQRQSFLALVGAPSFFVTTVQIQTVIKQLKRGSLSVCSINLSSTKKTQKEFESLDLQTSHSYSLFQVFQDLKYGDNNQVTLFKLRNPWGNKGWNGDWSFNSKIWTKALREKVFFTTDPKDGTFFMSKQDFQSYFTEVVICQKNEKYKHSSCSFPSSKNQYNQSEVKITTKGKYFFSIFQQEERKYRNHDKIQNYQKSKSWLMLAKTIKKDKNNNILQLQVITSNTQFNRANTLEADLDVGEYVIISSVEWLYWESYQIVLSSYGEYYVQFAGTRTASPHILKKFIQNWAKSSPGINSKKKYSQFNVRSSIFKCEKVLDSDSGLGYIKAINETNLKINSQVTIDQHTQFDKLTGIKIIQQKSVNAIDKFYKKSFVIDPKSTKYLLYFFISDDICCSTGYQCQQP